jgi:small ubiquitin-related modifier
VPDEPEPEAAASTRVQEAPVCAALTIFLRDASGKKQQFKVRGNTKFAQVFDAYCESTGRERASANFTFDGDKVRPDATPGDLDLEDDDVIDVK